MRARLLLLCSVLGTAACSDDPVTNPNRDGGILPLPPASIVSFAALPARPAAGDAVILSYDVGTATSVEVTRLHEGAPVVLYTGPAPSGRLSSGPIIEPTTFQIRAWGGGASPTGSLVVDVDVPAVVIRAFTATPDPADLGAPVTVAWDVDGATQVRVLDDMTALVDTSTRPSGQLRLTAVTGLRKLVLEARNPWRTVTQALELHTSEPASVLLFAADPPTFGGASSNVRLSWDTRGERVSIQANGRPVAIARPQAITSSTALRVTEPTVLELRAEGLGGAAVVRRIVTPDASLEREPNEDLASAAPLIGGAVGRIDGDFDVDLYRVSVTAGSQLYVQLTDPRGKCLASAAVRLLDAEGFELLQKSAGDRGGCAFIDPHDDTRARALDGDYYLEVRAEVPLTQYALAVLTVPAECGNGILERGAGEECDDGALAAGDGCSATCTAEVIDTFTLPGPVALRASSIAAGRVDYYRLEVTQPVMATLETGVPQIGRCDVAGADTVLSVIDAGGEVVGLSDDEVGLCAAFGQTEPLSLPTGSYLVAVSAFRDDAAIAAYELRVAGFEPRCGDDLVALGEACDDGNTADGDGCAADCSAVEVLSGPVDRVELQVPSGAVRVVDVQVTRDGQSITATTSDGAGGCGVDTRLVLSQNGVYLGYVTSGRSCAIIDPRVQVFASDLAAGTYRLHVVGEGTTGGPVFLDVAVTDPACGNGILESRAAETCDDGNLVAGDGCSPICERLLGGTVTGPGGPPVVLSGAITSGGGQQVFTIDMSAPGYIFASVGIPVIGQCVGGFDPTLALYDAATVQIAFNDDSGGLCSVIDPRDDPGAHVGAGRYTLVARSFNGNGAIPTFDVRIELRPEGCGNEIQEQGESCDDGNVVAGDGCSPGCTVE